jgi:hypothetical protein
MFGCGVRDGTGSGCAVASVSNSLARTSTSDFFGNFGAAFSNPSIYNVVLVEVRRPGAVAVASPAKWAQVGRWVKIGAHPVTGKRCRGSTLRRFMVPATAPRP